MEVAGWTLLDDKAISSWKTLFVSLALLTAVAADETALFVSLALLTAVAADETALFVSLALLTAVAADETTLFVSLALLTAVAADETALFVSLVLFTVAAVKFPEVVSAWTATVDTPPKRKKDIVAIAAKTNFLPSLYIL